MENQRNLFLAMFLMLLVYVAMITFGPKPAAPVEGETSPEAVVEVIPPMDRSAAVTTGDRIQIQSDLLEGSMLLDGARIDDISLKAFKATLDEDSANVVLMSPERTENAYYLFDGWARAGTGDLASDLNWTQTGGGDALTPESPVTLSYEGDGFTVARTISLDDGYLFTLDDVITNTSGGELSLVRQGVSRRYGTPEDAAKLFMIHEGPASVVGSKRHDWKYSKLEKNGTWSTRGTGGWVGLSDKFWLGAAIPPQGQIIEAEYDVGNADNQVTYEARYTLEDIRVSAGSTMSSKGYAFAGAKTHSLLESYETSPGIDKLDSSIHWGARLGLLVKPFSNLLTWLNSKVGNFGLAILLFTLIVKLALFPLNNMAYGMQARMKALQPKVKRLQSLYADDRMKLQQEMMALYRKEKVNPMSGCLPMIPQMFIFFALYKALLIIPEMRHASFLWIPDLSERDPTSVLNLFGLLPWDAIPFSWMSPVALGFLALAYGGTMAMVQTLNSMPGDKMQARIFQFMPLIFMFVLAPFMAGLLLYWVWSTVLTFLQQYYITRRHKVETPLDRFFKKIFGKKDAEDAA